MRRFFAIRNKNYYHVILKITHRCNDNIFLIIRDRLSSAAYKEKKFCE